MSATPGRWSVEPGGFVGGPVGKGRVCQLWNKFEEDFPNAVANARLIAAAPDLLAGCKAALGAFERNDALNWDDLRRAIEKAEGAGA